MTQATASHPALNPGVRRREVAGWSMYDFANSGYTTVVLTAVYNAYFVSAVAGSAPWATLLWTAALSLSYALVMLLAPVIGGYADRHAAKKKVLAITTLGCVACTVGLGFTQPGTILMAVILIIASNLFFSLGESINAAFLPELAKPEALGKVSGWGWSLGYFGGMLALGLSLAYVLHAQSGGAKASEFVPVTMWITAAVFALACIPTFILLKDRGKAGSQTAHASTGLRAVLAELRVSWRLTQAIPDFRRLLLCAVFYQAGIAVVIALAAIYAAEAMKFTQTQTMALIFLVNIASAVGAFGFGYFQDRLGHTRALRITLVGWIVMVVMAAVSTSVAVFWVAAVIAGLCMGASQSCGRAMAGAMIPEDRLGEFYGLWTLATRAASILGPLTYGLVTWVTSGNHRLAILVTGIFFVLGLFVLARINVQRASQDKLKLALR